VSDAPEARIAGFAAYARRLAGDHEDAARGLCERLFQAFGWHGLAQAQATCRPRSPAAGSAESDDTLLAELVWGAKLLIEIRRRGTRLEQHQRRAFEHWQYRTAHPRYVILCNFEELWIYGFNDQIWEPLDRLTLDAPGTRYTALNFLYPEPVTPIFANDRVAATRVAADRIATLFDLLVGRGVARPLARRFIVQCVLSLFAQSTGLLPRGALSERIAGRRRLFDAAPIDLSGDELDHLARAADEDWSRVQPAGFGEILLKSIDKARGHALAAHFTGEADVQRIVSPTLVRPWRDRIRGADTPEELDPACGAGSVLYTAYRELVRLEVELVEKLRQFDQAGSHEGLTSVLVRVTNFRGIDRDPFAIDLAKVILFLGQKLALDEIRASFDDDPPGIALEFPAPVDALTPNFVAADALSVDRGQVDVVLGDVARTSDDRVLRADPEP
jgi:hypothetical protein